MNSITSRFGSEYLEVATHLCRAVSGESDFTEDIALSWPYIGSGYDSTSKRVLIVGKAMNGHHPMAGIQRGDDAIRNAIDWCVQDRESRGGMPSTCENWLSGPDGAKARRSPFWQLSAHAFETVTSEARERWWTKVAWTNLYKLAPTTPDRWEASAPASWLREVQHTPAADGSPGILQRLLRLEVNALRPAVVVCIVGHQWMHHFWHKPDNNPLGLHWTDATPDWRKSPVHKFALEDTGAGTRLWIVTQRPEFRRMAPIVEMLRDVYTQQTVQRAAP